MVAAKRALRGERRRILAEARAFEAFLDAVDDVPVTRSSTTSGGQYFVGGSDADRSGAVAVRRAYADTVMGVSHYADDYDDTYSESIAAEFGPDVASALLAGPFTALCKRAVRAAASDARARRTQFLATLEDERQSLAVAERTLRQVSTGLESLAASSSSRGPFENLDAVRSTLVTMERRCKSVAADRQVAIQEHALTGSWRVDTSHVQEYLYADIESTYPVLATVADILLRIERRYECDERPLARA